MPEKLETVLVCYTQANFENLEPDSDFEEDEATEQARLIPGRAGMLATALRATGVESDVVKVPQRSFEPRDITKAAFAWRLMDLKESNGRPVDIAICLDFPAWALSHPYKVCWLSSLPYFVTRRSSGKPVTGTGNGAGSNAEFLGSINSLLQSERRGLAEAWRLLAGSRTVAEDMARSGLQCIFNPFPEPSAAPDGLEWQAVITRFKQAVGKL
jgi:hypothetical protein